jgi:hypothetical protein
MREPRPRPGGGEGVGERTTQHSQLREGADVEAAERVETDGDGDTREGQKDARQPPRRQAFIGKDGRGHQHAEHGRAGVEDGGKSRFDELLSPGHQPERDRVVETPHDEERVQIRASFGTARPRQST